MALFAFIGVAVTSATVVIYGEAIWDPVALMGKMGEYMEVSKFEPKNWRAVNDDVLFNVDWKFTWKPTGKVVETQAIVRKVLKDGNICEKYHMVDTEAIAQQTPRGVIEA